MALYDGAQEYERLPHRPGDIMSFGTYARLVRNQALPYGRRYTSLRCAVGHYMPLGFNAT
jgi:hypothetical protein